MRKLIAALLLIAILPLPYTYYTFLRPIVFFCVIILLINDWKKLSDTNKFVSILIAVPFNPFFIVQHTKEIWIFIDLASSYFFFKKYQKNS